MPQLAMILGASLTVVKEGGPGIGEDKVEGLKMAEKALATMHLHKSEIKQRLISATIQRCVTEAMHALFYLLCNSCIQEMVVPRES